MCYLLSIGEENAEVESDVIQLKICEVLDNTTAVPECEKTDILCEDVSRSCKAKTGVTCWSCDNLMEPDHQCEESSTSSSNTVSSVNETALLGKNCTPPGSPIQRRIIRPKKFCDLYKS